MLIIFFLNLILSLIKSLIFNCFIIYKLEIMVGIESVIFCLFICVYIFRTIISLYFNPMNV